MNAKTDEHPNAGVFPKLVDYARECMGRFHVPGAALGMSIEGQDYAAGLGVTSVEQPQPVTPETIFQVASITKTVTATALFRLIERGKANLDDPVRRYLPAFQVHNREASERATVRHLLNHTSGWVGNLSADTGEGDDALALYVAKMADLPQVTPLGAFYTYNNAAFNVAGRIIEILTGQPYEVAIRELVLDPLNLRDSFFFPAEAGGRQVATGYYLKGGKLISARPWTADRGEAPCGGLGSNVHDLLSYARFHMGDGTTEGVRLLTPDTLAQMQTPAVPTEEENWTGLNWFIRDLAGLRFVSHGGSTSGHNSILWMAPGKKLALVVLTNLEPGSFLCQALKTWVLERCLDVTEPDWLPVRLSPEQLRPLTGRYALPSAGDLFELRPADSGLWLTFTPGENPNADEPSADIYPPMRIAGYAPDRFMVVGGPYAGRKLDILRDKNAQVTWLRFDGAIATRIS